MPKFAIETTYHLPIYRQRVYEAPDLDYACRQAVGDDDWQDEKADHETSGQTYITGAWDGDACYRGHAPAVPDQFGEAVQRQADLFADLLTALKAFVEADPGRADAIAALRHTTLPVIARADMVVGKFPAEEGS